MLTVLVWTVSVLYILVYMYGSLRADTTQDKVRGIASMPLYPLFSHLAPWYALVKARTGKSKRVFDVIDK